MKVIIVGAGIGGLSAYHALQKFLLNSGILPVEVKIYEAYGSPTSTTSNIGGGLGLAPNGLRAISSVSPRAAEYIQQRGFAGPIFAFRNSSGRLLGRFWNGRKERYGFDQLMVRRAVVHEGLLQDMPADAISWGTKVHTVSEIGDGVLVEFSDGTTETADLVIGADGVRSVVRKAIFENQYPAEYDGLTGVGGFVPLSSLSQPLRDGLQTEGVTMTFGRLGFFGYSLCSPRSDAGQQFIQWWSIYESPTPPSRDQAHSDIQKQLLGRHGSWKSPYDAPDKPVYREIISLGCGSIADSTQPNETLLVLPRYLTPRLPHWCSPSGSGKIVLLGDAAHAMPPDSGQGVSCAAEDAVAIGFLMKHYFLIQGLNTAEALRETAKAYEGVRMRRVWHILDIAKRSGDKKKRQSWWQERIRDLFVWLFCRLPESINDRLLGHDVEAAAAEYLRMVEPQNKLSK